MNESESDAILRRLQGIEDGLRDVNRRIEALERARGLQEIAEAQSAPLAPDPSPHQTPPPFDFDLTREPEPPRPKFTPWPQPIPPPFVVQAEEEPKPASPPHVAQRESRPRDIDEVEYKIGSKGLLWLGAAAIVVGLIFLVAIAISRQWISPAMQFGGEIALCLSFIGIGFWKRNEKEEFGQLLTGIGSCGLYLSFAGAHVYKGVISGETLVASFVALSLANLGFAFWRSSRSFLTIGLIGGLVASALPMRKNKIGLNVILFNLILLPTTLIVRKNK